MENVAAQVHGKFKVFSAPLGEDGMLGSLSGEVEAWVRSSHIAPKSIGIEYIESSSRIVLSIGYRDDEPAYEVKLKTVDLGRDGPPLGMQHPMRFSSGTRRQQRPSTRGPTPGPEMSKQPRFKRGCVRARLRPFPVPMLFVPILKTGPRGSAWRRMHSARHRKPSARPCAGGVPRQLLWPADDNYFGRWPAGEGAAPATSVRSR